MASLALAGCDAVTVLARVDEVEAARTVRSLEGEQIPARTVREGREVFVQVPRAQVADAVRVLRREPACPPVSSPLLGTEADARTRREQSLSARLEETLRGLPGVSSARVLVTLAPPADFDVAAPRPRAVVVVSGREGMADDGTLRALVAAGVEGMRADEVRVTRVVDASAAPPRYAWVGPFAVAPASAGGLRAALAATLAAVAGLSAALLRRAWRRTT
jgi:type III secretory pathway lipoprotein EscJ